QSILTTRNPMLPNSEGKRVPRVTFRTRRDGKWQDVTSDEIFNGRTVAVFALPGAYTPTCSSSHVPRYNELAPTLKKHGVDEIVYADTMLGYVAPNARAPESVTLFAKHGCPYCARARELLESHGMVYEEVFLGDGITSSTLRAVSGKGTAPQVFIGGRLIGG